MSHFLRRSSLLWLSCALSLLLGLAFSSPAGATRPYQGPGVILSSLKLANAQNGAPDLAELDFFGSAVAVIGDLNLDGVADLALGAPGDDADGASSGAVYVAFMHADGTISATVKLAGETNGGPVMSSYDAFGASLAGIGDLDRDGVPDLAVGAPGDDSSGPDAGAVYVLFLRADGAIKGALKLSSGINGAPVVGDRDGYGSSVASLGDLNGDGVADLAIGASGDDTIGSDRGAVYVTLMQTTGLVLGSYWLGSGVGGLDLADSDRFGASVAGLGDLNRDGVPDLAIGASGDSLAGQSRGAVYVTFLRADGSPSSTQKLAGGSSGVPVLADNEYFGSALAAIGDLNRDGLPDLAIGAPGNGTGGKGRGAVYVAFLRADGTFSGTVTLAHNNNGGPTLENGDNFGGAVAALGDFNHDGAPDLLVGAPYVSSGAEYNGAVFLVYLQGAGPLASLVSAPMTVLPDATLAGNPELAPEDYFGISVTAIGDLDRDGVTDLAIGSTINDDSHPGVVYIAFMNAAGEISRTVTLASGSNGAPTLRPGDAFGASVAALGDLNGDGVPDLAIGALHDGTESSTRGAVYIAFMQADGAIGSSVKLADNFNGGPPLADDDFFGVSVAAIGDLNHDGTMDLAIGAARDGASGAVNTDSPQISMGAVYIAFMGRDGSILSSIKLASGQNGIPELSENEYFGISLAAIGDLNRDGVPDLAIGAVGGLASEYSGAVYIAFMAPDGIAQSTLKLASSTNGVPVLAPGELFGRSVAAMGDLNGDGVPDLAIGASSDLIGDGQGALYLAFLQADGSINSTVKLASLTHGGPELADGDSFGTSAAAVGDLNRDGIADLAIGAPGSPAGADQGVVYLARLVADGSPVEDEPISELSASSSSPTTAGSSTSLTATITSGTNVTYVWDMGDGNGGEGPNPSHTYGLTGFFTATVTATNSLGSVSAFTLVTVQEPLDEPITQLTAENSSPAMRGTNVNLTARFATGVNVTLTWDLGDGTQDTGPYPSHTYALAGFYTATVTATNSSGSVSASTPLIITNVPISGLTAINSGPTRIGRSTNLTATIEAGTVVTYIWDLGDGSPLDTGRWPAHNYAAIGSYTAVVTATNSAGSLSTSTLVTIVDMPISGLTARSSSPTRLGLTTALTATALAGTNVEYLWNFGDGSPLGGGRYPTHTYPLVGSYTAVVTATNPAGSLSASTVVVISPIIIQGLAAASSSPTTLGATTRLSATITAGTAVVYTWTFGDGTTGSGSNPAHTYTAVGQYTATVRATNSAGYKNASIGVTIKNVPFSGLQAVNSGPTRLGVSTRLTATVIGGTGVVYSWSFGDGTGPGSGRTLAHSYAAAGQFTATVTATNGTVSASASTRVTITNVPISGLGAISSSPDNLGQTTRLTATLTAGTGVVFVWNYGDGTPLVTGRYPAHIYARAGRFTAVVTATNSVGQVSANTVVTIVAAAGSAVQPTRLLGRPAPSSRLWPAPERWAGRPRLG